MTIDLTNDRTDPAPRFPALPAGYTALAAWGFHDEAGFAYEFYRVYRPPKHSGEQGEVSRLDEALSYWAVSFPTFDRAGNEHMAGRWVNLADAQKLCRSRLTYQRFSSPLAMSQEVPRWLQVRNLPMQAPQPFMTSGASQARRGVPQELPHPP